MTGDFPPELDAAIARILKAAQDEGKKSGIYSPSAEFANRYADMGFQMVSGDALRLCVLQTYSKHQAPDLGGKRHERNPYFHG